MIDGLANALLEAGASESEARVMFLVAEGYSYPEIARQLGFALHSVECYASRARRKLLQHQTRLESVAWNQMAERSAGERVRFRQRQLSAALNGES